MKKTLAGIEVDLNEDGFLTEPSQWTREVGAAIAEGMEVDMTEKHWQVIEYLREKHGEGIEMSIRKVGKSGLVDIKEFYKMFPGGPLKNASRIAGLPRPTSCV